MILFWHDAQGHDSTLQAYNQQLSANNSRSMSKYLVPSCHTFMILSTIGLKAVSADGLCLQPMVSLPDVQRSATHCVKSKLLHQLALLLLPWQYALQRRTGSKLETAVTATAMRPRTIAPAMTELTRFLRVGVTAASATKGLAIAAPTDATTAAEMAACLFSALQCNNGLKWMPHQPVCRSRLDHFWRHEVSQSAASITAQSFLEERAAIAWQGRSGSTIKY